MASATANVITFLAIILVLLPFTVTSDFLAPLLSPVVEDVCKEVACGKGTCRASHNSTFFYECQCDAGWKQARSAHDDHLKFLPCIIPNCSLNHACNEAPSPVQQKSSNDTRSLLDPCHWIDCGGGSCNRTSQFTYSCVCAENHYNLLNASAFPCFKECAIGLDCANLGISASNLSSPPPSVAENSQSQANYILQGSLHWVIVLIISLCAVSWS